MNPKYPASRLQGLVKLRGKTYEEVFGPEKAAEIKEKMRQAKLGRKMPWNSVPDRVGEKSPRWIKDRSKIVGRHNRPFHSPEYKHWRKAVMNRDDWKCRLADDNCNGKIISHHILPWRDYPELRFDVKNGIALCHFHHPRRKEDEKRLAPDLQALVEKSG